MKECGFRTFVFWKMHGAGNDFILIDDRDKNFPEDQEIIANLCKRRTGIGSDGLILIRPSQEADFSMIFFNPDGRKADMCGNGARCVARLAHDIGIAGDSMRFSTGSGIISATVTSDGMVELVMSNPKDIKLSLKLKVDKEEVIMDFINTGVPHVVIEVNNIDNFDLEKFAPKVRYHSFFAPAGTNVNIIEVQDRNNIKIRTYERGVEGETYACGTGIVASAIISVLKSKTSPPITVTTKLGYRLKVNFIREGNLVSNVTLLGPAEYVFTGQFKIPFDG